MNLDRRKKKETLIEEVLKKQGTKAAKPKTKTVGEGTATKVKKEDIPKKPVKKKVVKKKAAAKKEESKTPADFVEKLPEPTPPAGRVKREDEDTKPSLLAKLKEVTGTSWVVIGIAVVLVIFLVVVSMNHAHAHPHVENEAEQHDHSETVADMGAYNRPGDTGAVVDKS